MRSKQKGAGISLGLIQCPLDSAHYQCSSPVHALFEATVLADELAFSTAQLQRQ